MAVETYTTDIEALLGDEAESLLGHRSETFPASSLHLPGPDFVDRIYAHSDRNVHVLRNLYSMFGHGRLGGTGYLSILPVDQGRLQPADLEARDDVVRERQRLAAVERRLHRRARPDERDPGHGGSLASRT